MRAKQTPDPDRPAPPGTVRLSVVIPAFGEEAGIGRSVTTVREALASVAADGGLEIVVVDDGSADATAEAARAGGADVVIPLPENRGKGAAVRQGVLASHGRTVVFTDADLAYPPAQLVSLLELVEAGWDMVVGNRRHRATRTLVSAPRLREIGGRAINALTHAVLEGDWQDTQCGLKAFRSDAARVLFGRSRVDGFAFDVELFVIAERHGLAVTEAPVEVANTSSSTVRVARDAMRLVRDLIRIRHWARQGLYDP